MKQNTKGFTLIELLAVIVILAIIALIATPIVLNLIDEARKGAAESDVLAYVKAVETSAVTKLLTPEGSSINYANATCTIADGKTATELECTLAGGSEAKVTLNVDIKGTLPDTVTISMDGNGSVNDSTFEVNGYNVEYKDGVATVTDNKE